MQRVALCFALAAGAVFSIGSAWAQANRTFVSGQGSDANPCTLSAPCRSFAQAITQTNAGGEITILDPAGYGTVTINKAISIINDGVGEAGVTTASAMDAITINAGVNDEVNLRGLTLVGGAIGNNGVTINSGGTINIENSVIRGFLHQGINMVPTGNSKLVVLDTTISANFGGGINVAPSGNLVVRTVIKRVQLLGNGGDGIFLYGGTITGSGTLKGTAIDSLASGNGHAGFEVASFQGLSTTTVFEVINCQAVDNFIGVQTTSTDTAMYLAQTTVSDNVSLGYSNEGTMFSFGNNYLTQNPSNIGSLTSFSPH